MTYDGHVVEVQGLSFIPKLPDYRVHSLPGEGDSHQWLP